MKIIQNDTIDRKNEIMDTQNKDAYSFLKLSSWHVANAKNIKDYVKAYNYAVKAVRSGYTEGYYILGQLLLLGTGCEKNPVKGLNYLQRFVNNSDNNLFDDEAVADAYYKLTTGYYELKKYNKALHYYDLLKKYNISLADKLTDLEVNSKNADKENKTSLVKHVTLCACAIIGIWVLITNYRESFLRFLYSPRAEAVSVITNIDINSVTKDSYTPANHKSVENNNFYLLSKEAFEEKELEKVEITNINATSEYQSSIGTDYSAACLIDEDINTTWQEGVKGAGLGETIHCLLPNITEIKAITILNGKAVSDEEYNKNNRLQTFTLNNLEDYTIRLEDKNEKQYIYLITPISAASIDIIIDSIYKGSTFDDTCITDIEFWK